MRLGHRSFLAAAAQVRAGPLRGFGMSVWNNSNSSIGQGLLRFETTTFENATELVGHEVLQP